MTPQQTAPALAPRQNTAPAYNGFSLLESGTFRIATVEEAATLARFAGAMFRHPEKMRPGLFELFLNAVEHGCLGIGHAFKAQLLAARAWEGEILRRQALPENTRKRVEIVIARRAEGIFTVVTDPGPGFDWKPWITVDPARARDPNGRGIAKARSFSFDSLSFNGPGNQVAAFTRNLDETPW